jgi:Na+/melibiose symporter-like transporter
MLADVVDRSEAAAGQRRSGAHVAIFNLAFKLGLALGVGVAFLLLDLIDFDPARGAQHGQTDIFGIRILAFGLPALLAIPAIAIYLRYPLTRQMQQQLRAMISDREHSGLPLVAQQNSEAASGPDGDD